MGAPEDLTNVVWTPHPGSQTDFLRCPAWEVLLHGTRGGGKSDALLMDYAQDIGKGFGPRWLGILFRRSYKQLADIILRSKRWYPLIFPQARFNESELVWHFPDGELLMFRYLKRPSDYLEYQGWEVPWVGYDELTQYAAKDAYEKMLLCSRSTAPGIRRKIRATTNPLGPGHNWVKARFIDPAMSGQLFGEPGQRRCNLFSSLLENEALMREDPEYLNKLKAITDVNLRKAWLEGRWDIVAGGMFDDVWRPDIHVLEPFDLPRTWSITRSFDWGSSRPFSVGWWARSDGSRVELEPGYWKTFPKGTIFRIAEWYGWNGEPNEGCKMLNSQIALGVVERDKAIEQRYKIKVRPGAADSSIFDGAAGKSIADEMSTYGVRWEAADKSPGSRVAGAERLRDLLEVSSAEPLERPGLYVFSTCRQFIRTVPVLPRDEKNFDDVDSDAEDHIYDETRYEVMKERRELRVAKLQGA